MSPPRSMLPMSMIRGAGLLLCLLSLGACSSVGTYVPPAEGLPAAVVIGANSPLWSNPSPFGFVAKARFTRVNDDTLSRSALYGYPSSIRVPPGKHYVEVQGELRVDGRSWAHGTQGLYEEFEAGCTYFVHVKPDKVPGVVQILLVTSEGDPVGESADEPSDEPSDESSDG